MPGLIISSSSANEILFRGRLFRRASSNVVAICILRRFCAVLNSVIFSNSISFSGIYDSFSGQSSSLSSVESPTIRDRNVYLRVEAPKLNVVSKSIKTGFNGSIRVFETKVP